MKRIQYNKNFSHKSTFVTKSTFNSHLKKEVAIRNDGNLFS